MGTVFKTFDSDIDCSMSKIGMFNKSFSAMKQDLANGLGIGFSIFGGQAGTKSDRQAILNLNTAKEKGINIDKAWATTMSKASAVAQEQARKCVESGGSLTDLAKGLKTTTLAAQGTQFALQALSSIGNMALIWLISEAVSWIATYNQRMEESRQAMIEAGQAAADVNSNMADLVEQYRKLGEDGKFDNSDREQAKNIQEQLNELLGDEAKGVNLANGKYEDQLKLLRDIQYEKAKETDYDIETAYEASKDSLLYKADDVGSGAWTTDEEVDAVKKLKSELKGFDKYLHAYEAVGNGDTNTASFKVDTSSAEAVVESYEKMVDVKRILEDSHRDEIRSGGPLEDFYNNLKEEINELSDAVTKYKGAMSDYNTNQAVIKFNETEFDGITGALIRNEEELTSWISAMLASEDISDGVKQELLGLASTSYPNMSNAIAESSKEYIKNQVAVGGDITELKNLASTCGITEQKFEELVFATTLFNNKDIGVSDKIAKLRELGYELDIVNTKMNGYQVSVGTDSNGKTKYQTVSNKSGVETIDGKRYMVWYDNHNKVIKKELLTKEYGGDNDDESPPYTSSGTKDKENKALNNYLKDAENRYKIHQDEAKYIKELQWAQDNLVKSAEEELEITDKINEAYRNLADNRIKDLEHQNTLLEKAGLKGTAQYVENLKAMQRVREEEANRLRALGYDDNSNEIQSLQSGWWDDHSKIVEADFANSEDYIDERNRLGDWHLFNDSEVEAWERVLNRYKTQYPNEIEKIKEIEKSLYDARKEEYEKSLEDMEAFIDARDNYNDWESWGKEKTDVIKDMIAETKQAYQEGIISLKEYNDKIAQLEREFYDALKEDLLDDLGHNVSQINSLETLLQSYYDVTNSIAEAQHELNKELETSKTMYEYLNEDTRKLLFNQEDYNALNEELADIQKEADRLQKKYTRDVRRSTAENLNEITSQYQMQYEMLMKSYEIAKADLEVAKKKQQLNNVLKERNVRMFVDGQWQWVADTEAVQNAQNELSDAKYEQEQAELSALQEESKNALVTAQDKLATTINNVKNGMVDFDEQIYNITGGLSVISSVDVPALETILSRSCRAIKNFAEDLTKSKIDTPISYSKNFDYSAAMAGLDKNSSAWQYLNKQRNAKIDGEKLSYTKYAGGTRRAKPGASLIGENGAETLVTANGVGIPITLPTLTSLTGGEVIFNSEQMQNLRSLWDLSNYSVLTRHKSMGSGFAQSIDNRIDNSIVINGLTVNEQGNEDWVNGLRRYVATHKH